MVSVYDIKPQFQRILRPALSFLHGMGISPNMVTLSALFLSVAMGAYLHTHPSNQNALFWLGPFLLFRMALNAIDGLLAREYNLQSKLGAVLNELGDVLSDIALYLPLAFFTGFPMTYVILAVLLSVVTEVAGLTLQGLGASRRFDGPMGKSDRALVIGVSTFVLSFGVSAEPWLTWMWVIVNVLLVITIINRAHKGLKEMTEKESNT